MKNFRVSLESRFSGIVSSRSLSRGRPEKGTKRKKIGKIGLFYPDDKLYLKVVDLKDNEIPDFIRDYQVTLPWNIDNGNKATLEDIKSFQKDVKSIFDGIKKYEMLLKGKLASTHHTIRKITGDVTSLINKYIKDCYLYIDLPPFLPKQPSEDDMELYSREINDFKEESSGHLPSKMFYKYGKGGNFVNLMCRSGSLLSWCVLNLVLDLLIHNEMIRYCKLCEKLFSAQSSRQKYCDDKTCQAERARKRQRKSRGRG